MSKGQRTREHVLEQASALFNQLGYEDASISAIMAATGLKKGGIYRHFANKEALELEAFDYSVQKMQQRFAESLAGKQTALARLLAIVAVYAEVPTNPPVPGGCPILNAAVEADDKKPLLRARAQQVMTGLQNTLRSILREGQKRSEFRADLNLPSIVNVLMSQLEGAVMLAKLNGNDAAMKHTVAHLQQWFETFKNN